MLNSLLAKNSQVEFLSHAQAILSVDFPQALAEFEAALAGTTIPIEEIVAGGGGEAKGTQRLHRDVSRKGWVKTTFVIEKRINGVPREKEIARSRPCAEFENGARIALEIEWNNKDPFYDSDLENFKRLHADGAISLGIIVTRGKSLQENMADLIRSFLDERQIRK